MKAEATAELSNTRIVVPMLAAVPPELNDFYSQESSSLVRGGIDVDLSGRLTHLRRQDVGTTEEYIQQCRP